MRFIVLSAALVLSGCAASVTPLPTGGSKSDGVVVLSYQLGTLRKPVIDWEATLNTATQKCQAWGFRSAEAFGGSEYSCVGTDMNGNCTQRRTNISYQCLE
tara:strand:- start:1326 stop:1628 length:303 start_codon:yes stop_codon:yes gene_type:complete